MLQSLRRFSIRTLIATIVVFAIIFAILAFRHRALHKHRTAIVELQRLGARVNMTTSESRNISSMDDSIGDWRHQLFAEPSVYVPLVGFQNPDLTEDDVRAMIPHLTALIPLHGQNIAGESFIVLDINNSPIMTTALRDELEPLPPGLRFMGDPNAKPGPSAYHPGY